MRTPLIALVMALGIVHSGQAQESGTSKLEKSEDGPSRPPYSKMIAFCDSLSDVGNVAGITEEGTSPRIDGYYEETHYSDNIIWIEWIAQEWGIRVPRPGRGDSTSLKPRPRGSSWAWGNAESAAGTVQPDGVTEPLPNLLSQVEQYLDYNHPRRSQLFVLWCGADNLLVGEKFGPEAAREAVDSVIQAMEQLEAAGARSFLVVNMPRLGDTPEAQGGGPIEEDVANLYALLFNSYFDEELARLRFDPRFRADIYFANAYTELALIVDSVNSTGSYVPAFAVPGPPVEITNVADQSLDVYNQTGEFPTDYLFFDDVHPTTQGHQIIAGKMLQALPPDGWRGERDRRSDR